MRITIPPKVQRVSFSMLAAGHIFGPEECLWGDSFILPNYTVMPLYCIIQYIYAKPILLTSDSSFSSLLVRSKAVFVPTLMCSLL